MKKEKRECVIGILSGVTAVILIANFLNIFFDWKILAVAIGFITGLEVGYWTGAFKKTLSAHKDVYFKYIKHPPKVFIDNVYPIAIGLIAIAISLIITNKVTSYYEKIGWFQDYFIFLVSDDWNGLVILCNIGYCSLSIIFIDDFLSKKFQNISKILVLAPLSLAVGILVGVFSVCLFIIALCLLCLLIFYLVFIYLVVLIKLMGDYELMAITIGVIIGGLAGLIYGGWTKLEINPTIISVMIGCAIGLTVAWGAAWLGQREWFLKFARSNRILQ